MLLRNRSRRVDIRLYTTLLLLGISVVLQVTLLPHLAIGGIKPNLTLALVALWSLLRGRREGGLWALMGGILSDILSGAPFGIGTLSLLGASAVCGLPKLRMFHSRWLLPALVVAGGSVVHDLISLALLQLSGWPVSWRDGLLLAAMPAAALSAVCALFVYPVLHRLAEQIVVEEVAA